MNEVHKIDRWMPLEDAMDILGALATSENRLTRPEKDAVTLAHNSLQRSRGERVRQFWDELDPSAVMLCCPRCRKRIRVGYNVRQDSVMLPNYCDRCGQRLRYEEADYLAMKKKGNKNAEDPREQGSVCIP